MFGDTVQYPAHKLAAHGTTGNCVNKTDRSSLYYQKRGAKGGAGGAWRAERLEGKRKSRTNHARNMLYGPLKSGDKQNKWPMQNYVVSPNKEDNNDHNTKDREWSWVADITVYANLISNSRYKQ
jgi:hypothetical protein